MDSFYTDNQVALVKVKRRTSRATQSKLLASKVRIIHIGTSYCGKVMVRGYKVGMCIYGSITVYNVVL